MHRVWEWDFAQHAKECQKLAAETKKRTRKMELLSCGMGAISASKRRATWAIRAKT